MKIKRGEEGKIKKLRNRVPTVVLSGSDFFFLKVGHICDWLYRFRTSLFVPDRCFI